MKRILSSALFAALLPAIAFANSYSFSTTGLTSLSHGTAYTWGLSPTPSSDGKLLGDLKHEVKTGAHIESATLTITGLYDWVMEPADVLYINLLNNVKGGIASYTYNSSAPSYDTVFGSDVFNVVEKPVLVAPVAPVKPTLAKPTAPTAPKPSTLTLPVPPVAPVPPVLAASATAAQIKAYNTALTSYNAKLKTYNTALTSYNTKLTAYNAAQAKYATDKAAYDAAVIVYNTKLTAYNAAQTKYAVDKAAYDAAVIAYNAALPAYKVKLAAYDKYAKTKAALGYDGVPLVGAGDSIYDQGHSLLRADVPNGPGTWTDLDGPKTKTNLVITFSYANLELLQALLAHATSTTNIGLGFGPECHFYDKDIKLQITTIPDAGATLALFGLGLLSLVGVRRFSKRSR
jgi:hypothetical protein